MNSTSLTSLMVSSSDTWLLSLLSVVLCLVDMF